MYVFVLMSCLIQTLVVWPSLIFKSMAVGPLVDGLIFGAPFLLGPVGREVVSREIFESAHESSTDVNGITTGIGDDNDVGNDAV